VINVQMHDASVEVVLVSDELPAEMHGKEIAATLSVITGHLICDAPVIIGKNSFEQTLFLRFNGEALVRIKRNYIRTDVLIPFIYTEHGKIQPRLPVRFRHAAIQRHLPCSPPSPTVNPSRWQTGKIHRNCCRPGSTSAAAGSVLPAWNRFNGDGALAYRCFLTGRPPKSSMPC